MYLLTLSTPWLAAFIEIARRASSFVLGRRLRMRVGLRGRAVDVVLLMLMLSRQRRW
jgi:hypothetical protein